jgi:NADH-quinone oxidoreductase E subunit
MTFHPVIPYGVGQHKSARELPEEGAPFAYTPENRARFEEIAKRYPPDRRKSAILPALWLAQRQNGYITASVMAHVADVIGCSAADVEDVVSFYTMYYTKPMGKYVIQVCRTLSCALVGAERVTEELSRTLGIKPGETDAAREFSLLEVECLGACDRGPVVMVNEYGWHENLRPDEAGALVDRIRADGEKALSGCVHRVEK